MTISDETIIFLVFVVLGMFFSFIFDIFRALRKIKHSKNMVIYIQDIVYFTLIGVMLLLAIININADIRFYLIIAIVVGVAIYISIFGNFILNIFVKIFKMGGLIIEFLLIPIVLYTTLFNKQINILKKIVLKCCKKISYMINFNHVKTKFVILKKKIITKEDCINVKSGESKVK